MVWDLDANFYCSKEASKQEAEACGFSRNRDSQNMMIFSRSSKRNIFILLLLVIAFNRQALAAGCDPDCVINVVWENVYHTGVPVGNLYYRYVPDSQWAKQDCVSGSFAQKLTRTPKRDDIGYLFGWAKYYYDENRATWVGFGGISAKYFITRDTPFHGAADLVLEYDTYGSTIAGQLNSKLPGGCSHFPDNNKNFDGICHY